MPIDEDILRDLMRRSTGDLHAPPDVAAGIVTSHRRRHRRNRVAGVAVAGAAAGTAIGLVVSASGGPAAPAPPAAAGGAHHVARAPGVRLTAAQRTLYHLSSVAASAPQPRGRYVAMSEITESPGPGRKISVFDTRTGDIWTYQKGDGAPSQLPVDRHGSRTEAEFAAMPTDPAVLRALLLREAKREALRGLRAQQRQLRSQHTAWARRMARQIKSTLPLQTDDQLVFQEATDTLWNPLVGPALRSALFKVLATTAGVTVDNHARDSRGRPAIKIFCVDDSAGSGIAVFEKPAGTGVLELLFTFPQYGPGGNHDADIFLTVQRSATLPPNPYLHS